MGSLNRTARTFCCRAIAFRRPSLEMPHRIFQKRRHSLFLILFCLSCLSLCSAEGSFDESGIGEEHAERSHFEIGWRNINEQVCGDLRIMLAVAAWNRYIHSLGLPKSLGAGQLVCAHVCTNVCSRVYKRVVNAFSHSAASY